MSIITAYRSSLTDIPSAGLTAVYPMLRNNIMSGSEDMAYFTSTASVTLTNGAIGPLGAADAIRATFSGGLVSHYSFVAPAYPIRNNELVTGTVTFKLGAGVTKIAVEIRGHDGSIGWGIQWDQTTNTFQTGLPAWILSATVVPYGVGTGWYTLSVTWNVGVNPGTSNIRFLIYYGVYGSVNIDTMTTDIWHYQCTVGAGRLAYDNVLDGQRVNSLNNTYTSSLGPDYTVTASDPVYSPTGLVFDGIDDCVTTQTGNPGGTGDFTWGTVITLTAYGAGLRTPVLSSRAGSVGVNLVISGTGETAASSIQGRLGVLEAGAAVVYSTYTVALNIPIHLTLVGRAGNVRLYANGILVQSGSLAWTAQGLISFMQSNGINGGCKGTMHYTTVHNRALTDTEVYKLYTGTKNRMQTRGVIVL